MCVVYEEVMETLDLLNIQNLENVSIKLVIIYNLKKKIVILATCC